MMLYLLKSIGCLLILWGFYKIALEDLVLHTFKRFYLLGSLALAIMLPLVTITYTTATEAATTIYTLQNHDPAFSEVVVAEQAPATNWLALVLWCLYGIGFTVFAFRFTRNLYRINHKIRQNEKVKASHHVNVLLPLPIVPHSFLKYIFLPKQSYEAQTIPAEVYEHEQAHVTQKHTWDVLFIEFVQVVFWFNPVLFYVKKSIRLNHEFLADQNALRNTTQPQNYINLLLNYANGTHHSALSSPINYSLTKKRIVMLSKPFSAKKLVARLAYLVPVLILCIYFFNQKIIAKPKNAPPESIDSLLSQDGSKAELEKANSLQTHVDSIVLIKHIPSSKQLKEWQNESQYGVWVDGKRLANNKLKTSTPKDFSYYRQSKLEKNAINYGNHFYQIDLMTPNYFEAHKIIAKIRMDESDQNAKPLIIKDGVVVIEQQATAEGKKKLKIDLNRSNIAINGQKTTLSNFAKTIDAITGTKNLDNYNLEITLKNVEDDLIKKLALEFRKTFFFKNNPDLIFSSVATTASGSPVQQSVNSKNIFELDIKDKNVYYNNEKITLKDISKKLKKLYGDYSLQKLKSDVYIRIQVEGSTPMGIITDVKSEFWDLGIRQIAVFMPENFNKSAIIPIVSSNQVPPAPPQIYKKEILINGKARSNHEKIEVIEVPVDSIETKSGIKIKGVMEIVEGQEPNDNIMVIRSPKPPMPPVPPAPPKSPLVLLDEMVAKGSEIYLNGKKISAKKAQKVLAESDKLTIHAEDKDGKTPKLYIYEN